MKRIFKYAIPVDDRPVIDMPIGARVLSVDSQHKSPYIWALVEDSELNFRAYHFHMIGTGHPADRVDGKKFVGTFQLECGALVFHLFKD